MLTFDSMEVRLLKPHELGVTDSVIDVAPGLANYLVQCNVAVLHNSNWIDETATPATNINDVFKSEPKKRGPKKKDK